MGNPRHHVWILRFWASVSLSIIIMPALIQPESAVYSSSPFNKSSPVSRQSHFPSDLYVESPVSFRKGVSLLLNYLIFFKFIHFFRFIPVHPPSKTAHLLMMNMKLTTNGAITDIQALHCLDHKLKCSLTCMMKIVLWVPLLTYCHRMTM